MKQIILVTILLCSGISAMAEVREFSPIKVIVDTEHGIVLREPTRLDYEFALEDQKQADKDKPLLEKVFGKKKCHAKRK